MQPAANQQRPGLSIAHVGTVVSRGGASAAMCHLHESLLKGGVSSTVVTLESSEPGQDCHIVTSSQLKAERNVIQFAEEFYVYEWRTPISNTFFSLDLAVSASLEKLPVIQSADIIHLHWVAGFLSSQTLLAMAALKKPIFWTLHDARPITGGCHFPAGCQKFTARCVSCPQLKCDPLEVTDRAQQALHLAAASLKFHYIAPSSWLYECAQSSTVAVNQSISRVPNGVDVDQFRPMEKKQARQFIGLRPDVQYILLGAQNFEETRKGGSAAQEILHRLTRLPEVQWKIRQGAIRLACFGQSSAKLKIKGWKIDRLGYLDNRQALCAAYSACDLLLFTSQEDNLPNVIMESMACELPVAGFSVGGVPDLIVHGQTGLLLNPQDLGDCAGKISEAIGRPDLLVQWGKQSRLRILETFTLDHQRDRMADLYRKALADRREVELAPPDAAQDGLFLDLKTTLQFAVENSQNKIKRLQGRVDNLKQYVKKCRRAPWKLYGKRPS